eukprot:g4466.t1
MNKLTPRRRHPSHDFLLKAGAKPIGHDWVKITLLKGLTETEEFGALCVFSSCAPFLVILISVVVILAVYHDKEAYEFCVVLARCAVVWAGFTGAFCWGMQLTGAIENAQYRRELKKSDVDKEDPNETAVAIVSLLFTLCSVFATSIMVIDSEKRWPTTELNLFSLLYISQIILETCTSWWNYLETRFGYLTLTSSRQFPYVVGAISCFALANMLYVFDDFWEEK